MDEPDIGIMYPGQEHSGLLPLSMGITVVDRLVWMLMWGEKLLSRVAGLLLGTLL